MTTTPAMPPAGTPIAPQAIRLRTRFGRPLARSLTVVLLVVAAAEAVIVFSAMSRPDITLGMDFHIYLERSRSWLAGNGFYLPSQVSGPYLVNEGTPPSLYPPVMLYLTVPFTVLPAFLWWVVPLGIIALSLWRVRPPSWTWPILAALLIDPRTWIVLVYGNPSMWALAALAAGMAWRWPMPLTLLKPTLWPFALYGLNGRRWWIGAAVGLLLALPFGAMWIDYATAITNARNGFGLDYLVGEWPIAAVLVGTLRR